jgi:hypothetical protein
MIPLALKTSVIASVVAVLFGAFQYALVHQAKENTAVYAVFCNAGEEDRTPAINLGSKKILSFSSTNSMVSKACTAGRPASF